VADNWHTPKVFAGLEAGMILTGGNLKTEVEEDHPVRLAYSLWSSKGCRYSWDLVAVECAVDESSPHYRKSPNASIRFDEMGRTLCEFTEDGMDCYIELAQPDEMIIKDLNDLLIGGK